MDKSSFILQMFLQECIHGIDRWTEPMLVDPERMRPLGHEDKLMGDPVRIQPLAKLREADFRAVELSVNEQHGRGMRPDMGQR